MLQKIISIKNKILIILSTLCLLFSYIVGCMFRTFDHQNFQELKQSLCHNQVQLIPLNIFITVLSINIKSLLYLLSGSVLFGLTTLIGLIQIGFGLGVWTTGVKQDTTLTELIIVTLPHGIFEIPAIIIAGAAGFKIPYEIIRYLAGRKEQILTKEDIKEYLTLALISIILIVIAAFVEAYITPRIAEYFLSKGI